MTATGVRISELVLFDVEDVKKGYRDIYSKGNKLRRVYIPAVLRTAFKEWPGFFQRPDGILFLNRFGAPLSASGIRFQLKVFAARYGIDPDGILLSVGFSLAAVLIIYYKQISEGYEDQARFDIMQKLSLIHIYKGRI